MLRFSRLKTFGVILIAVLGVLFAMPSLLSEGTRKSIEQSIPGFLPRWIVPHQAIVLGLDLQGGSHVLLEVDTQAVLRGQVNTLRDDVRRLLREEKISLAGGIGVQARGVTVRVADQAERQRLLPRLNELAQPVGGIGGLGAGGQRSIDISEQPDGLITMTVTDAGVNERVRKAITQAIEVLRRRVDALGTTEPNIQAQGQDRILVQVPGLQDPRKLKEILGTTAQLEFRLVADPGTPPGDVEQLSSQEEGGGTIPVEKRVMVQGEDLIDAQPGFDQRTGEPIVNFKFNIRGAQRFGQVTTENVGRPFAIVLDKKVISAPRILQPITGGQGQISGRFTVEAANNLAILLRAGALPAPLTIVEERTVGPGLGQDSIDAGKKASYVATVLVVGFMFVSYGLFGLFANIALAVHVILIFALMSLLGSTLTLPGIAGIVLTIGTAVDSNVLIYERIREEARAGRSMISSLEAGFQRAFATIIDSNVTMFIAATILFFLGSGPVKGFAVTLILGIVTTVVTAVTMTRMMIALWYRSAKPTRLPF
ncbi:protein translocase subunit SecD [Alsobacter soli]|uniref:Protein translocase subunit SecD n=1 Tax=Alsobacter soli TaxID=2109933 RepID=A0A2T1HV15_9HYPH|nr:protein translocase subunit SecD [Alsobacter soli]PSC05481.1 protein translocase subunit SecD [Alsobacter soli]